MVAAKRKDTDVEIKDLDDLLRAVLDVRSDSEPLVIAFEGGQEIVVIPALRRVTNRQMTLDEREKADEEAFLSSAGSLAGLFDPDEFTRQYRSARGSRRPAVIVGVPDA